MAYQIHVHSIKNVHAQQVLQLFSQEQHRPWSFLLDSCEQTDMGGRYDILVFSPCLTYTAKNGEHLLSGQWTQKPSESPSSVTHPDCKWSISSKCAYTNLAALHAQFTRLFDISNIQALKLPFILGAVGAFAYDGNVQTDKIKDEAPNQYALPDVSVAFYHNSIIYDNKLSTLHICTIDTTFIKVIENKLSNLSMTNNVSSFALSAPWTSNVSERDYFAQFGKIESYLRNGDCYQVNYAQRFSAPYTGNEWTAYTQLRTSNNAPFSAFVRLPTSVIMSLSPERFLLVNDRQVESKPIKGTRKRSPDPATDLGLAQALLSATKDKAENLMIVDLLRNDLSKFCEPYSVNVPKLFALESYPAVHHMVSTVVGKLKATASLFDLFKGAFPGGSITGAPKVRAMQIIQELEPDKRAIYCGSIGYMGIRDDMDSNICIRTLLAENGLLYCWAGGGIVIDSTANDEYQESLDKVARILPVLSVQSNSTKY